MSREKCDKCEFQTAKGLLSRDKADSLRMESTPGISLRSQRLVRARAFLLAVLLATGTTAQGPVGWAQQAADEAKKEPLILMPRVDVIGDQDKLSGVAGSANIIDQETLEISRPFNVNEVLRKVPGLHLRDEEGFGLRPNIGIRGLNPTRSTKLTLLEDGVPLSYAPYGENASYYHPPIDRFERIEVLKGTEQLLYGPQSIGGIINYITPTPPEIFSGFASLGGGNRDFFDGKLRVGGKGLLLDYTRKQGDGSRDNISTGLNDVNVKWVVPLPAGNGITLRANVFTEDSMVTYSGLTLAEFNNLGARYNPFRNDEFEIRRYGGSATHQFNFNADTSLITNLYFSNFNRDWWRQSSTSTDGQCGAGFTANRLAGVPVNPNLCNSVQGRLRSYYTGGVEPRLSVAWAALGMNNELTTGFKLHFERQERKQINATSPKGRSGTKVEDNLRDTQAYSGFISNRFTFGPLSVTPILRYEHVRNSRENRLPGGTEGSDSLDAWIPGIGITYTPIKQVTLFTGVHKGFAPPRTEDVIGGTGTSTDVGAEESVNFEFGVRAQPWRGVNLQAVYFRNYFDQLIAVGSIAGGNTPLAEGKALFQGLELSGSIDLPFGFYYKPALTWLPTAKQETAFRQVVSGAVVPGSAKGNRQPYAPELLFTNGIGYRWNDFDAQLEVVHVGSQYADFANTKAATANGQAGKISSYTILNLATSYNIRPINSTLFVTVKNLADKTYITDRTRGIMVGMPLQVFGGLKYAW